MMSDVYVCADEILITTSFTLIRTLTYVVDAWGLAKVVIWWLDRTVADELNTYFEHVVLMWLFPWHIVFVMVALVM